MSDHPTKYVELHRDEAIDVGLIDTRAADSLLITYDFERDGYVIKQAKRFAWEAGEDADSQWTEVAFIRAWALATWDEERGCFK